ncbi:5-methylcytosine-specific restriction protein A [Paraburkholderia youngii]|uniref:HNH endonuclease n=1 Tax=Paraburkholderia youngii TaxID=2782701 RepID=UPI003D20AE0D
MPSDPSLRGSGGKWQGIRARQLKRRPLCELCEAATPQRKTPATVVDHKRRLADGGSNRPSNLQSLCEDCHKAKTRRERNGGKPAGCDVNGLPLDPLHPWYKYRNTGETA